MPSDAWWKRWRRHERDKEEELTRRRAKYVERVATFFGVAYGLCALAGTFVFNAWLRRLFPVHQGRSVGLEEKRDEMKLVRNFIEKRWIHHNKATTTQPDADQSSYTKPEDQTV